MAKKCALCGEYLGDGKPTATLTEKGCIGIAKANLEREIETEGKPGDKVYVDCRHKHTN